MRDWLAGAMDARYWEHLLVRVLESGGQIIKIVIVYLLLRWLICYLVRRTAAPVAALEKDPIQARRIVTLSALVRSTLLYILAIVAGLMLLTAVGMDPIPLVTAAGVAGLAVGFGAQKLVRDVINGFFILLENQFAVGETITIGAVTGTISEVGLRTTRLTDAQGKLFIFANGDITTVCNHSRNELTVPLEISIAASADIERATALLDEVGLEVSSKSGLKNPYRADGVTAFDANKVTLRLVGNVPQPRQEEILSRLREEVRRRFMEQGIPLA